jgi:hypothetical protein
MTPEIVPADDDSVARFYGVQFSNRWIGKAIRKGRLVAGFGGAMEISDGVWFAFLDIPAHLRRSINYRHILAALGEMKSMGAQTIRAACESDIPGAEALLQRLGFLPTDEEIDGRKVWEWRS